MTKDKKLWELQKMDKRLEILTNFFLGKTSRKYLLKNTDKNSWDICKIKIFQNFGNFERMGNSGLL